MSIRPPSGSPSGGAPTAHAASHASGGTDAVTLAESQITGLVTDLAAKAPLASPALTGNPTAPNQTAGNNSTRLANTAYVDTASGLLIPKSLVTTKGDLIAASGSGTLVRVPVGADGTILTADAASAGGVKFAAGASPPPILGPTGAIRETYGRQFWDGNAQLLASGSLYLAAIPLVQGDVVSNITFYNAVSMTGQSHWWFALFNSSFQMLAVTADQLTTGWTSGTSKATLPIAAVAAGAASSFAATYTGAHYVGVMVTASGTKPNVQGKIVANGVVTQDTPILGGLSTGSLTAPPAFPFTAAAPALSGFVLPYAYVS